MSMDHFFFRPFKTFAKFSFDKIKLKFLVLPYTPENKEGKCSVINLVLQVS